MASPLFRRTLTATLRTTRPFSFTGGDPNDVVSSVVSILTNLRSKTRWSTILSHHSDGFTPLQISQILLRIRNNPVLANKFFRFTTQNSLTQHDAQSFSTMIHILARSRRKSSAQDLIRTAIRICDPESGHDETNRKSPKLLKALVKNYRCCDSAPFVFDLLIRAYLDLNRVDSCLEIVKLLKSGGVSPDVSTCNSLISRVSRQRGPDAGYDLYKELFGRSNLRPNSATFNGLMIVYFRQSMLHRIEEIWMEMGRLSCSPNSASYTILIAAYCEDNQIEKAYTLLEEIKSKGLRIEIAMINTLIGAFCKIGDVESAEKLYKDMEVDGIQRTGVTYQHLVHGYCKVKNGGSAVLMFKEMCRKGHRADASAIDEVVRELCEEGLVLQGLELVRGCLEGGNVSVWRSSYVCLIKGLCEEGEMDEALGVQAEMVGHGFEPCLDVYAVFVDGYERIGRTDMVERLRSEMNREPCVLKESS